MISFSNYLNENFEGYLTEAVSTSGYNDEHGFSHVWNHAIKHGLLNKPISELLDHLEIAKRDPSHPLSFESAPVHGFKGRNKEDTPERRKSYFQELHNAAMTIHGISHHPDIAEEIRLGSHAHPAGDDKSAKLSDEWRHFGGKNSTSKADIKIGKLGISYKKYTGSQLMSAEPDEFKATYHTALNHMIRDGWYHHEHDHHLIHSIRTHIDTVADNLAKMKHTTNDAEKTQFRNNAHIALTQIHDIDKIHTIEQCNREPNTFSREHSEHGKLLNYVYHEAASGLHKFGGPHPETLPAGAASHLVTSYNPETGNTKISRVDEYRTALELGLPRAAKPKGDNRPGNVKIDIKKEKKIRIPKAPKIKAPRKLKI